MVSKNPFLVLGLNSNLVKSLSDDDLQKFIKSNYRNLQMIYHPDKFNGSDKRSKELSEAYEILTSGNEEVFNYFKGKFTRVGRNKQEEEIGKLEIRNKILSNTLINYFDDLRTGNPNVFNSGPCELLMYDYARSLNVPFFRKANEKAKEELSYKLIIDKNNDLFIKQGRNRIPLNNKNLIGCISDDVASQRGGIKSILKRASEIYTPDDSRVRRNQINGEKFSGITNIAPGNPYENKINPQSFKNIMHFITPELSPYSYLFSINSDNEGHAFYSIDGKIREIKKRSK